MFYLYSIIRTDPISDSGQPGSSPHAAILVAGAVVHGIEDRRFSAAYLINIGR